MAWCPSNRWPQGSIPRAAMRSSFSRRTASRLSRGSSAIVPLTASSQSATSGEQDPKLYGSGGFGQRQVESSRNVAGDARLASSAISNESASSYSRLVDEHGTFISAYACRPNTMTLLPRKGARTIQPRRRSGMRMYSAQDVALTLHSFRCPRPRSPAPLAATSTSTQAS